MPANGKRKRNPLSAQRGLIHRHYDLDAHAPLRPLYSGLRFFAMASSQPPRIGLIGNTTDLEKCSNNFGRNPTCELPADGTNYATKFGV